MGRPRGDRGRTEQMKCTTGMMVALVLMASLAGAARQGKDERELIQLVKEIQAATTRQDANALDKVLAEEFVNIHSTGVLKTRAEWLADLRASRTKFANEEPDQFRVRI